MNQHDSSPSRRNFLSATAATALGSVATLSVARFANAAGNDLLKVGLIGCGGRGTGAAIQALSADPNVKLWAMADAFDDRVQASLKNLEKTEEVVAKLDVPPERRFSGFNAYQHVIDCCDVVLLCTPPQFRPLHLKAAVAAGKHVFAEKPCAVDAPGVRSVLQSCQEAKQKNLAVVSGLCLRFDSRFQEAVRRIHDGAIGNVTMLQANDYRGSLWVKARQPDWSDMTWQMRNWYYFTWLSGDFNVEQHVHFLDVAAWVMKDQYPEKAIGMGGRAVRNDEQYGQIYDHFSVVYEYADGAKLFSNCRQQAGCANNLGAQAVGTKGTALMTERNRGMKITNEDGEWMFSGKANHMYQVEHDEMFASIRNGKPLNNGEYMAKSTLLAIMGRMAAYTGQNITWEMAMNSKEDLTPPKYDWDIELPVPPVARPGVTKFF